MWISPMYFHNPAKNTLSHVLDSIYQFLFVRNVPFVKSNFKLLGSIKNRNISKYFTFPRIIKYHIFVKHFPNTFFQLPIEFNPSA